MIVKNTIYPLHKVTGSLYHNSPSIVNVRTLFSNKLIVVRILKQIRRVSGRKSQDIHLILMFV